MRDATLILVGLLAVGCAEEVEEPGSATATDPTVDWSDPEDTGDTEEPEETGDIEDTGDTADTADTGDTADSGIEIAGTYIDDWGATHTITDTSWDWASEGAHAYSIAHTILSFSNDDDYAVAENGKGSYYVGFSRFDWAWVDDVLYYCQGTYDAKTAKLAEAAAAPDSADLKTGCGGFSWSSLTATTSTDTGSTEDTETTDTGSAEDTETTDTGSTEETETTDTSSVDSDT